MADQNLPNPSGLKADIDAGRTGDKIPASDPAAAPLGTDAEAANAPASQAEIDAARRAETDGVRHDEDDRHSAEPPAQPPMEAVAPADWKIWTGLSVVIGAIAAALVAAVLIA